MLGGLPPALPKTPGAPQRGKPTCASRQAKVCWGVLLLLRWFAKPRINPRAGEIFSHSRWGKQDGEAGMPRNPEAVGQQLSICQVCRVAQTPLSARASHWVPCRKKHHSAVLLFCWRGWQTFSFLFQPSTSHEEHQPSAAAADWGNVPLQTNPQAPLFPKSYSE